MSDYIKRLRKLSENEKLIYNDEKWLTAIDFMETQETKIKELQKQLENEKAKSKALLVGLEVQNIDEFIDRADVESYKKLGKAITIGFKEQIKGK